MKTLSRMYRAAWRQGLKTTYYLRTLGASNIEKATINVRKQTRGLVAGDELTVAAEVADPEPSGKEYTEEETTACGIEAMLNGGECEACQ